jgi:hypothetical protein
MNKQHHGQEKDMVKFTKSLLPRWYSHAARMPNKLQALQCNEQGNEDSHVKMKK